MRTASKRLTALASVAVASVLVAACSTSGSSSDDGKKTVTIMWQSGDKNSLDAVIKIYEKENPDVTIKPTYVAPTDMQQTMRTRFAAGSMTDLTWVWPGNGNVGAIEVIAPAGYLADLSDEAWVKDVPDDIRELSSTGGKTYAFMTQQTMWGGLYNTEAMTKAGLEVPTTWSEVLQFCKDAKAQGLSAYALGTATNYETQNTPYALYPELVEDGDPEGLKKLADGSATFADTGWKTLVEKTKEMADAGCHNEGFQGTDVDAAHKLWASGKSLAITSIGQYLAIPEKEITVAPLPATDDPAKAEIGLAPFGGMAANAKSKNLAEAKKFIEFLATPKIDTIYVNAMSGGDGSSSAASGSVPVLVDQDNVPSDPVSKELIRLKDAGLTGTFPDQLWPNPEVQANMYTELQKLYTGDASVADVLKGMQTGYDKGAVE